MTNALLRLLATAAATAVAAWLVPGIDVVAPDLGGKGVTLAVVALIFGLVNMVVKPLVKSLTGCLVMATLGLFLLVINAFMLMLTSWIARRLGYGFQVDGFVPALVGSVVISAVAGLLSGLMPSRDRR